CWRGWIPDDDEHGWARQRIGTVHTAQGRENEAVIFLLGAPAPAQDGARTWAGGRPNLPNVAGTRAKEVLYVVGNRRLWREAGVFSELGAVCQGDAVEAVLRLLRRGIDKTIAGLVQPRMVWDAARRRPVLQHSPGSLWGAAVLQFALAV